MDSDKYNELDRGAKEEIITSIILDNNLFEDLDNEGDDILNASYLAFDELQDSIKKEISSGAYDSVITESKASEGLRDLCENCKEANAKGIPHESPYNCLFDPEGSGNMCGCSVCGNDSYEPNEYQIMQRQFGSDGGSEISDLQYESKAIENNPYYDDGVDALDYHDDDECPIGQCPIHDDYREPEDSGLTIGDLKRKYGESKATDDYEVDVDEYIKTGDPTQKLPKDKRVSENTDFNNQQVIDFTTINEDEIATCDLCGKTWDMNDGSDIDDIEIHLSLVHDKAFESKANEWLDSSYQDELLYSKYYKELQLAQNMIRDGNTNPSDPEMGRPIFKHNIADYLWNTLGLDGVPSDKLDEIINNLYKLEGKVAESNATEDFIDDDDDIDEETGLYKIDDDDKEKDEFGNDFVQGFDVESRTVEESFGDCGCKMTNKAKETWERLTDSDKQLELRNMEVDEGYAYYPFEHLPKKIGEAFVDKFNMELNGDSLGWNKIPALERAQTLRKIGFTPRDSELVANLEYQQLSESLKKDVDEALNYKVKTQESQVPKENALEKFEDGLYSNMYDGYLERRGARVDSKKKEQILENNNYGLDISKVKGVESKVNEGIWIGGDSELHDRIDKELEQVEKDKQEMIKEWKESGMSFSDWIKEWRLKHGEEGYQVKCGNCDGSGEDDGVCKQCNGKGYNEWGTHGTEAQANEDMESRQRGLSDSEEEELMEQTLEEWQTRYLPYESAGQDVSYNAFSSFAKSKNLTQNEIDYLWNKGGANPYSNEAKATEDMKWWECEDCKFFGKTEDETNKHELETGHTTYGAGMTSAFPVNDGLGLLKSKKTESKATEGLDPNTTDTTQCTVCGRKVHDHSNPNTDFRGNTGTAPPTDHYFTGGNLGGSDDKPYFTNKHGGFAGYDSSDSPDDVYINAGSTGKIWGWKEGDSFESKSNEKNPYHFDGYDDEGYYVGTAEDVKNDLYDMTSHNYNDSDWEKYRSLIIDALGRAKNPSGFSHDAIDSFLRRSGATSEDLIYDLAMQYGDSGGKTSVESNWNLWESLKIDGGSGESIQDVLGSHGVYISDNEEDYLDIGTPEESEEFDWKEDVDSMNRQELEDHIHISLPDEEYDYAVALLESKFGNANEEFLEDDLGDEFDNEPDFEKMYEDDKEEYPEWHKQGEPFEGEGFEEDDHKRTSSGQFTSDLPEEKNEPYGKNPYRGKVDIPFTESKSKAEEAYNKGASAEEIYSLVDDKGTGDDRSESEEEYLNNLYNKTNANKGAGFSDLQ